MKSDEILAIVLQLGALVSSITIGLTAVFKEYFPDISGRVFSVPCGAFVMAGMYLASFAPPVTLQDWMVYVFVCIIGGLLPSGLFDAGVSVLRKARK